MPAGIETFGNLAAFASLREPAWHGLGTVFNKPVSTEEMLKLSHLHGWDIRFLDLKEELKSYNFIKEAKLVIRNNPFVKGQIDVLGTVGKRYNIFSNESIFDFGDKLTEGRGRRWETAGSIKGGAQVFATLVESDDIILDPNGARDIIRKYLMLTSSHDASGTLIAKKVNTRVLCQNTLNIAMGERGDEFRIRHTQGMEAKLEDAKAALGFAAAYDDAFEREAEAMIETQMTKDKFVEVVKDIYPEPEDNARGRNSKWEFKMDGLMSVWEGKTESMGNLDLNVWRGAQTLLEYGQWFREVRAGKDENFLAAGAGFDNVTNDTRQEIWDRFLAEVPKKKLAKV